MTVVVLELKPPRHHAEWAERLGRFVRTHRRELSGEVIARLKKPAAALSSYATRFADRERDVLARTSAPQEARDSLAGKRNVVDAEREILGRFLELLKELGRPRMRPDELARIRNMANLTHLNASWVMRKICGYRKRGELPPGLRPLYANRHGSPWVVEFGPLGGVGEARS